MNSKWIKDKYMMNIRERIYEYDMKSLWRIENNNKKNINKVYEEKIEIIWIF